MVDPTPLKTALSQPYKALYSSGTGAQDVYILLALRQAVGLFLPDAGVQQYPVSRCSW